MSRQPLSISSILALYDQDLPEDRLAFKIHDNRNGKFLSVEANTCTTVRDSSDGPLLWRLIPCPRANDEPRHFKLKNSSTGKVIFFAEGKPRINTFDAINDADQEWEIQSESAASNYAVIRNRKNGHWIASDDNIVFPTNDAKAPQAIFQFVPTEETRMVIERFHAANELEASLTQRLRATSAGLEGMIWSTTRGNDLPAGQWIIKSTCENDNRTRLVEQLTTVFNSASSSIDILCFGLDGELRKKLISKIEKHPSGRPLRVRIFFGIPLKVKPLENGDDARIAFSREIGQFLDALSGTAQADIAVGAGELTGSVSFWPPPPTVYGGWNHAKIIVTDGGRHAIAGGMNFTNVNLDARMNVLPQQEAQSDTVHDLSMQLSGPAAVAAQAFIDAHWSRLKAQNLPTASFLSGGRPFKHYGGDTLMTAVSSYIFTLWTNHEGHAGFDAFAPIGVAPALSSPGRVSVMAVGRRGGEENQPSEAVLQALIDGAKHSLHLSQQALFYPTDSTTAENFIDPLVRALVRGVTIKLIVCRTVPDKNADADGGYTSVHADVIRQKIRERVEATPGLTLPVATIMDRFAVKNLCSADKTPLRNHAKLIVVDEHSAYIGSHNLYPNRLTKKYSSLVTIIALFDEFGFVVFSPAKVRELVEEYWTPLWKQCGGT